MVRRNEGKFFFKKDIGKVRVSNDDECKVVTNSFGDVMLILADGMGGQNKGSFASNETVSYLSKEFKENSFFLSCYDASYWIQRKLRYINKYLYGIQEREKEFQGMGTTLIIALLIRKHVLIINIGDSRCYFVKNKRLVQMSEDQTLVNFLYNSGQIDVSEKETNPNKHVLTNAVGLFPSISYDSKIVKYNNEKIFLCSDGLYNNVHHKDIEAILNTDDSVEIKVNSLIEMANFNGGNDNISICLWESSND